MAQKKYTDGNGVSEIWLNIKNWVTSQLLGYSQTGHTHSASDITSGLATVATSGSYTDLSNKPTIPSKVSQLSNDSGFITSSGSCNYATSAGGVAWDNVSGKPSGFTPYFANGTWYAVGDDVAIGDHNVGGGLGVKALNSTTTRIDFCYKDDASNYKSITYDGTTLYMNGNCDYATSAGSCNYANSAGSSSIATRDSGGSWISGRDNAVVKQTRHSTSDGDSWNPAVSIKTKSGNWTIGTVGYDNLQFSYDTDEDYNTGNNRNIVVDLNPESGTIITSANIGSQSVNYANSAGSAGSVAWGNVSGRPWALSQFTNDSGFLTSADRLPIGSYIQFAGSQAPAGFLVCNGGAISRTTYRALFAVIGTKYGSGDGSTTFNLPNLTDRFLQGSTTSGTVKNAGLPNITAYVPYLGTGTHGQDDVFSGALAQEGSVNGVGYGTSGPWSLAHNITFNASRSSSIYGNSTTVQPPALTCLICIKY